MNLPDDLTKQIVDTVFDVISYFDDEFEYYDLPFEQYDFKRRKFADEQVKKTIKEYYELQEI